MSLRLLTSTALRPLLAELAEAINAESLPGVPPMTVASAEGAIAAALLRGGGRADLAVMSDNAMHVLVVHRLVEAETRPLFVSQGVAAATALEVEVDQEQTRTSYTGSVVVGSSLAAEARLALDALGAAGLASILHRHGMAPPA